MTSPAGIESVLRAVDRDELVQITQELVRVNSENPPGNEEKVAEVAASWLERIGCTEIEFHAELPGRPSLLAWWRSPVARSVERTQEGRVLALNGHLDVVPAGDSSQWKHPPFSGAVEGGKIYGRGASDMKSGVAAMIGAVAALGRASTPLQGAIRFQLMADEENAGRHGAAPLAARGLLHADAAIVGEPTSLMVGIGERGALWAKVKAFGRAAHGSVPRAGVSAVEKIAKAALALHGRDFAKADPLFGSPTLNAGVVQGGEKVNVVADYAELQVDRRLIPGETAESALAEIRTILDSITAEDPEAVFDVEVMDYAEPSAQSRDSEIVRVISSAIEDCIGGPPEFYVSPGSSDARFLRNNAGVPTVLFGPGIMGLAHVVDEYVEIDSLVDAARVLAVTAARFLQPPSPAPTEPAETR